MLHLSAGGNPGHKTGERQRGPHGITQGKHFSKDIDGEKREGPIFVSFLQPAGLKILEVCGMAALKVLSILQSSCREGRQVTRGQRAQSEDCLIHTGREASPFLE